MTVSSSGFSFTVSRHVDIEYGTDVVTFTDTGITQEGAIEEYQMDFDSDGLSSVRVRLKNGGRFTDSPWKHVSIEDVPDEVMEEANSQVPFDIADGGDDK